MYRSINIIVYTKVTYQSLDSVAINRLELECAARPCLYSAYGFLIICTVWPHHPLYFPNHFSSSPFLSTSSSPSYLPLTSIYPFSLSSPTTLLQATPPPLPPRLPPSTPSSQPVPHQACHALYRTSLQRPLFPPYHICLSSFLSSSLVSCDRLRLVSLVPP